ncbi:hypothetical protein KFE25_004913 [Diacronema lutheri]|uniref:Photolyase/cryptochrome alpha/beta domain-containing protein n=2 Tax=Diacronema lutheri TaxID=2081491 RepID=A0A8J6C6B5_DIALT|nr:hypothetical protein KFE25_004913 [Diacronema lutheri]
MAGSTKTARGAMVVLLWYRKGLRVHDSPALAAACEGATAVCPVFCLDPWFVSSGKVGPIRLRFLAEALADLDASLRARGSRLLVLHGKPEEELPRVAREWGATHIVWEKDGVEPYGLKRDAAVREACAPLGVTITETNGHTICDLDELLKQSKGSPVTTYSTFRTHFDHVVARSPIVLTPTPERIPAPSDAALAEEARGRLSVPSVADIAPSLADAGPSLFPGGEGEALRRLDAHLARDGGAWAGAFEKPKTSPTEIDPFGAGTRSTTVLSAYLKFGCLSPRTFWVRLRDATKGARTRSAPPVSLDGQLLWREFYYACAHAVGPAFGQMEDNPICRQIGWRVPADDPAAAEALAAWRDGRTGYPWIDACMRQLKSEGWMHHLARHAVACFLTRGDLYVRWEEGAAVFDELLIDADWAVNNGNWMWLSCSCFFYQYFRCYSPVAFGRKYDPDGAYVRKYVPELARFPKKYIYEPWRAPIADQNKAGCRVGVDYPKPIVQHDVASKENMGKLAEAYKAHKESHADSGGEHGSEGKGKGTGKGKGAPSKAARGKAPAAPPPDAKSRASKKRTRHSESDDDDDED